METYEQHIELINNYLNNLLSQEAKTTFEVKLQNDTEFQAIYEEHIVFINGLERVQIKNDIQKAKQSFHTEKWLKISGVTILVLGAVIMLYTLVFNTSENEPVQNNESPNTPLVDSITSKKEDKTVSVDISEVQIDSTETDSEVEVTYTTTTAQLMFGEISETNINIHKKPQSITINVAKDTVIRCKEGTILKVTKGSFINPNTGKIVTGKVNLNVTEYYKLSDILLSNLSTVSNGNQLETGGMLYIEVTQGSSKLKLKEDSPIDISFPNKSKKRGMEMFSGEWKDNNINWTLQSDTVEALESVDSVAEIIEDMIEVPFNVVEVVPTFPGCEDEDNETRKLCTVTEISKFINQNFNKDVVSGLGLNGVQRINCFFKIGPEGNVSYIQSRAPNSILSQEADRVIRSLPKMSPGMQRGKPVVVPYSIPITFRIFGDSNTTNTVSRSQQLDSTIMVSNITFDGNFSSNSTELDTIYSNVRGIKETIREVMHDKDFVVDSIFIKLWDDYKKQRLIRNIRLETKPNYIGQAVILRKSLFEMENSRFKILEDDSISRGGHVIRIPWDETKIPSSRVMRLVPKQQFMAGNKAVTAEKFEALVSDEKNINISSSDVNYYLLKTSNLGWINCDRFVNSRSKKIKYKLKVKSTDDTTVSMVFKSINSVLPSWKFDGYYDFQTVSAGEDIVLVAIKRKNGKLYYDTINTTTKQNPQLDFEFKEVTIEDLKQELDKLNSIFN